MVVLPETHAGHIRKIEPAAITPFQDKGNRLGNSLALVRKVLRQMEEFHPDVVHLHSTLAGAAIRPFIRLLQERPKVVYCPHGWAFKRDSSATMRRVAEKVELAMSGLSDAIVCTSNGELDSAMGIGIERSRLARILNGIPSLEDASAEEVVWPDSRLRLLFVGRFDRQKGIDLFLAAMQELREVAFACVIGAPVVDHDMPEVIPDNVTLLGWQSRDGLLAYYRSADLLVMPSRWEGFGLVAAEAMRSGLAVLGTRIGGISDIVEDSVTGMLVEPESVQAIVSAIRSTSRSELGRMGESGRLRFECLFSSERMFSEMHQLYARLSS